VDLEAWPEDLCQGSEYLTGFSAGDLPEPLRHQKGLRIGNGCPGSADRCPQ